MIQVKRGFSGLKKGWRREKTCGSGGIRTHAPEETGALNQRLRPLGHATADDAFPFSLYLTTTITCSKSCWTRESGRVALEEIEIELHIASMNSCYRIDFECSVPNIRTLAYGVSVSGYFIF